MTTTDSEVGMAGKVKGRFELPQNKSTDSNETTSSEGSHKGGGGSSQSDSSGVGPAPKRSVDFSLHGIGSGSVSGGGGRGMSLYQQNKAGITTDLSRTESMSSTCSTLSIYGNSTQPSRTHSFTYDGGESSTYESLEVGDSVENLQVGFN